MTFIYAELCLMFFVSHLLITGCYFLPPFSPQPSSRTYFVEIDKEKAKLDKWKGQLYNFTFLTICISSYNVNLKVYMDIYWIIYI